nr:DUF1819 family protein [Dehalococcoidales bacterium]
RTPSARPRARVEDILPVFRQRYLDDESVVHALVTLVRGGFPAEGLDRVLYFHATQSDRLLHDTVTEVLYPLREGGRIDVGQDDVLRAVSLWVGEGKTATRWSANVILRAAQGLLSTLRDFGVLEGAVNKRLAPTYLPVEAFAYVAFYLHQRQPSGQRLIENPEWSLFFPIENKRHFLDVSADIVERVDPIFYGDPMTASLKALGTS